jgi:hypothetical protein
VKVQLEMFNAKLAINTEKIIFEACLPQDFKIKNYKVAILHMFVVRSFIAQCFWHPNQYWSYLKRVKFSYPLSNGNSNITSLNPESYIAFYPFF